MLPSIPMLPSVPMLESSVKKACLGWLKSLPNSHWWSNPVSAYGNAGRPDIEGCLDGSYVGIECKTPAAYKNMMHGMSPAQGRWREHIIRAGGCYIVADSVERLKYHLAHYHLPGYTPGVNPLDPDECTAE